MRYEHVTEGIFLERPNRFIAYVRVTGRTVTAHVKNTGRCRELLIPGVRVILQYHPGGLEAGRKTEYSLIAVYKGEILVNMDSQAPNQAAMEWLMSGGFTKETNLPVTEVRREVTYGNSRFDLSFLIGEPARGLLEDSAGIPVGRPLEMTGEAAEESDLGCRAYMEVKGVTLGLDHVAKFPDAPTERGVKHIKELKAAAQNGMKAYILFVIQMKGITEFTPNMETHPAFGEALKEAAEAGVTVLAYDCRVKQDELMIDRKVPVKL